MQDNFCIAKTGVMGWIVGQLKVNMIEIILASVLNDTFIDDNFHFR